MANFTASNSALLSVYLIFRERVPYTHASNTLNTTYFVKADFLQFSSEMNNKENHDGGDFQQQNSLNMIDQYKHIYE